MPIRDDWTMNSRHLAAYGSFYVVDEEGYYSGRCSLDGSPSQANFYMTLSQTTNQPHQLTSLSLGSSLSSVCHEARNPFTFNGSFYFGGISS